MKVLLAASFKCRCGYVMKSYTDAETFGSTIECSNDECENYGVKYQYPVIDLEKVEFTEVKD